MKGEIHKSTIRVEEFRTPISIINRTFKHKINKDIEGLSNTINQLDLKEIYRILNPTRAEYTFISSAHETSPG